MKALFFVAKRMLKVSMRLQAFCLESCSFWNVIIWRIENEESIRFFNALRYSLWRLRLGR